MRSAGFRTLIVPRRCLSGGGGPGKANFGLAASGEVGVVSSLNGSATGREKDSRLIFQGLPRAA
jgi:hypothetical protein